MIYNSLFLTLIKAYHNVLEPILDIKIYTKV